MTPFDVLSLTSRGLEPKWDSDFRMGQGFFGAGDDYRDPDPESF